MDTDTEEKKVDKITMWIAQEQWLGLGVSANARKIIASQARITEV